MEKKQIYFIVNGTETTIFTDGTETVADLAKLAIVQAEVIQRPIDKYQVIHNDRTLNWNKDAFSQGVNGEDVIFLSLKAGVGAATEDKKAPVLDASEIEDEYIRVAIKEIVSLKNKIWNRAVEECIISIRENFQFMGGNVTKEEVIEELEQLKKK